MKFIQEALFVLLVSATSWKAIDGFAGLAGQSSIMRSSSRLHVNTGSIGLGPGEQQQEEEQEDAELVAGVDYEIPDHESYRTSRRSKMDEKCDAWFAELLGDGDGVLGGLAQSARSTLTTPVELKNDEALPLDDEEWTPYVDTKLPWTPLYPAFGLEQFGLPIPRRNAETWRHFDVAGMVGTDYSDLPEGTGTDLVLENEELVSKYHAALQQSGGWLDDEACEARLVYINGRFSPQLSKTTDDYRNLNSDDDFSDEAKGFLSRLPDGFTDELAAPVPSGESEFLTSYSKLSGPDHCVGEPTSQFAINVQQGTACFAALNTVKTGAVAYIHQPEGKISEKPVLLVNAFTKSGGASKDTEEGKGVTSHPRSLLVAEDNSKLSFVQSIVDLDATEEEARPKFHNGYTQMYIKAGANVTHSYLEESGGMPVGGVEVMLDELSEGDVNPRDLEAARVELDDTHLETVDVHVMGDAGNYEGTMMGVGGSGRVRMALSVSLLRPETHATVNGLMLSGGTQRGDMKTNIHHIAQGTTSEQSQKNMVGGRATAAFRGRIRVEQSAQQTNSEQLSRTILLSDRSRVWAVPSLEIIADDVQCTHGATVSDLSEEELFYLRSRGLDRTLARNLLMYAFVEEVSRAVDPAMMEALDSDAGFQKRVIQKLENLVPQGERAILGEFQSS
mmetsp:Transcript_9587/g.14720  ORF Transcript_9587/g.14720 Transcript_9587/m.14720 type:complete len:674 (-) Transcript_9587:115-2136(-)|eukprot:CAMPEP_0195293108 /NCGR_PEP_ID=MMETSP0707-20130614/11685_1 /TAXON_ID=33640 /ORGANISM="Asterionellopsis glacialis, Strain CCMP134" /LENGTH=673 /DNA_ID=CAMNT_0040353745 /DNA_START=102 /DNA_END=2123 /DNA_ORIENTATION=+